MGRWSSNPIALTCSMISMGLSALFVMARAGSEEPLLRAVLATQGLAFFLLFFPQLLSDLLKRRGSLGFGLLMTILLSAAAGFVATYLKAPITLTLPLFLCPFTFFRFPFWLFVTLYAKSTYKMPRQHTSNPKIPKVSQAIASPFY